MKSKTIVLGSLIYLALVQWTTLQVWKTLTTYKWMYCKKMNYIIDSILLVGWLQNEFVLLLGVVII
jgi:hypothetical protein